MAWILALFPCAARAEPAQLESSTSFISKEALDEISKEIAGAGKALASNPDQPGKRLRIACYSQPLPPGWVPGVATPLFSWSCLLAWEHRVPLPTSELWVPENEELVGGRTDGNAADLKAALRGKLYDFFRLPRPKGP